jgi:hypothetical protein
LSDATVTQLRGVDMPKTRTRRELPSQNASDTVSRTRVTAQAREKIELTRPIELRGGLVLSSALVWQCCTISMITPRHCQGNVMAMPWQCNGVAMAMPWQCHGNAMAHWHCHSNAVGMPRHCHGIAMAMPWHCHGNAMPTPWQCLGNAMPTPWQCH